MQEPGLECHQCFWPASACAWHLQPHGHYWGKGRPTSQRRGSVQSNGRGKAIAVSVQLNSHLWTTRIVPLAWVQEGTSRDDWRRLQDRHGFSWAAHRRVDDVSPVETTDAIGSGDDEPGSSKLGSQALPTAAAPRQREKEEHFVSHGVSIASEVKQQQCNMSE